MAAATHHAEAAQISDSLYQLLGRLRHPLRQDPGPVLQRLLAGVAAPRLGPAGAFHTPQAAAARTAAARRLAAAPVTAAPAVRPRPPLRRRRIPSRRATVHRRTQPVLVAGVILAAAELVTPVVKVHTVPPPPSAAAAAAAAASHIMARPTVPLRAPAPSAVPADPAAAAVPAAPVVPAAPPLATMATLASKVFRGPTADLPSFTRVRACGPPHGSAQFLPPAQPRCIRLLARCTLHGPRGEHPDARTRIQTYAGKPDS